MNTIEQTSLILTIHPPAPAGPDTRSTLIIQGPQSHMKADHWATKDVPLEADAAPLPGAPIAGGAVQKPEAAKKEWEWELQMCVIGTSRAPPKPVTTGDVVHRGGCHCGLVRFEAQAPSDVVAWDCNCSNCRMRRNVHVVVPENKLRIVEPTDTCTHRGGGAPALAEYRYGTGHARHLFCARCGISPFYRPRSNPDGWGVTLQCVDPGTISSVVIKRFDGANWEDYIKNEGAAIRGFSRAPEQQQQPAAAPTDAPPLPTASGSPWAESLSAHQFVVMPTSLAVGVAVQYFGGGVLGAMLFAGWMMSLVVAMLAAPGHCQ